MRTVQGEGVQANARRPSGKHVDTLKNVVRERRNIGAACPAEGVPGRLKVWEFKRPRTDGRWKTTNCKDVLVLKALSLGMLLNL